MAGLRRTESKIVKYQPNRDDISHYLDRGWLLISVDRGTEMPPPEPQTTRDVDEVMRWHEQGIGYAIVTGWESGIVALRVHRQHHLFNAIKDGELSLRELQGRDQLVTPTTKRGATLLNTFVYVFQAPEETIQSKEEVAPGLDFLGEGGYFLPPRDSMWITKQTEIAPLPDWLRSLATGESVSITEQVAAGNFSILEKATPYEAAKAYSLPGMALASHRWRREEPWQGKTRNFAS
jgi:hypothetical protein